MCCFLSGNWFKSIISPKKAKKDRSKKVKVHSDIEKANGSTEGTSLNNAESVITIVNGGSQRNHGIPRISAEHIAATRIQNAFRAYKARRAVRRRKGAERFNQLIQGYDTQKQALSMLNRIHSWSDIQAQIRARRHHMVTEGRIKQKKLDNQIKLDAKLQELEVEWCGGAETMEEILSRIQQREEAAVKRERAMAYAFSHQWRANPTQYLGQAYYNLGKENWGWSWKERWIAARPWEIRVNSQPGNLNKGHGRQASKSEVNNRTPLSTKSALSNGNGKGIGGNKAKKLPNSIADSQQEANPTVSSRVSTSS